jgi:segregation and condensation protein A
MAPRHTPEERRSIPALGVIAPPPIHVETPTFDGSLGALFACVRERKVDLLQIPLFPVCEAYFLYMLGVHDADLDEASAALGALSYLLERKAWLLLPSPDPEPVLEEPLELPAPSSAEYRFAIEALRTWHEERSSLFFRSPDAGPDLYELPFTLGAVSVGDLARAFERMMRKAHPDPIEPLRTKRKSLEDQMRQVLAKVDLNWRSIDRIFEPPFTRSELVYWFLALLELIRIGAVLARVEGDNVEFARA